MPSGAAVAALRRAAGRSAGSRRIAAALAVGVAVGVTAAIAGATPVPGTAGWRVVASPTSPTASSGFASVACSGAAFCVAVGGAATPAGSHPLTERFDGTGWTALPPASGGPADGYLDGVACVSPRWCMAVGQSRTTLAERWNGTSWSVVPSVAPRSGGSVLLGIACRSSRWCRAVGASYDAGRQDRTLIEAWDGSRWSAVASPNRTTQSNWLESVSCPTVRFCQAVGFVAVNARASGATERDLAVRWDGVRWSVAPTPDRLRASNDLFGVACTSTSWCVAVGRAQVRHRGVLRTHSELETWDGTSWSLVTTPATDSPIRSFVGVTCVTRRRCTVVGTRTQRGPPHTSVLSWDGARWTVVPSPDARGSVDDALLGVACPTPARCEAVGYDRAGRLVRTLAEQGP